MDRRTFLYRAALDTAPLLVAPRSAALGGPGWPSFTAAFAGRVATTRNPSPALRT